MASDYGFSSFSEECMEGAQAKDEESSCEAEVPADPKLVAPAGTAVSLNLLLCWLTVTMSLYGAQALLNFPEATAVSEGPRYRWRNPCSRKLVHISSETSRTSDFASAMQPFRPCTTVFGTSQGAVTDPKVRNLWAFGISVLGLFLLLGRCRKPVSDLRLARMAADVLRSCRCLPCSWCLGAEDPLLRPYNNNKNNNNDNNDDNHNDNDNDNSTNAQSTYRKGLNDRILED